MASDGSTRPIMVRQSLGGSGTAMKGIGCAAIVLVVLVLLIVLLGYMESVPLPAL